MILKEPCKLKLLVFLLCVIPKFYLYYKSHHRDLFPSLAAADCFELGRQSYNSGDHYHTTLWMTEALSRQEAESNKTVEHADILEYLAFSTYMQGNIRQALKLTNELLLERPNHQRAMGNKAYYEQALSSQEAQRRGEDSDALEGEAVQKVRMKYSRAVILDTNSS